MNEILKIKQKIVIDSNIPNVKDLLVKALHLEKNEDGYLVDIETKEPALTNNGKLVHYGTFAGILKGSTILLNSDIDSVFDIVDKTKLVCV